MTVSTRPPAATRRRDRDGLEHPAPAPRRPPHHLADDWQRDPYSRCAYSYAAVGGQHAHAALAKPIRNTLYFAGEATSGDETGTVAGAIESGRRAAKEALRA